MNRIVLRSLALASFLSLSYLASGCSDDSTEVSDQKTCDKGGNCSCNKDCSLTCDGGGCQFVCEASAKCSFSCKGGSCLVSGGGATTLDCSGGGCTLACTSASCSCTDPSKCLSN